MYYYHKNGANFVSLEPMEGWETLAEPVTEGVLYAAVHGDPKLGRGSFKVTHAGQLVNPHGLETLDASRLPEVEVDEAVRTAIAEGRLTAVNVDRLNWEDVLSAKPKQGKIVQINK